MNKLLIQARKNHYEMLFTENDQIVQYSIQQKESGSSKGNIYKAKVIDIVPGMDAAFVDIGEKRNAYLHIDDAYLGPRGLRGTIGLRDILHKGDEMLVQVVKDAVANKGAKVTRNLWFSGEKLVYLPFGQYVAVSRRIEDDREVSRLKEWGTELLQASEGIILRTGAVEASKEELERELDGLRQLWQEIEQQWATSSTSLIYRGEGFLLSMVKAALQQGLEQCIVDDPELYKHIREELEGQPSILEKLELYQGKLPLFKQFGLHTKLEKALRSKQWLKSGGYINIQPTEALTVIDVNTGKNIGKKSMKETILCTNLEAAQEIARQLRLRDIGGLIIIDFIDMEDEEDKQLLLDRFKQYLQKDKTVTYVAGMTSLGLVEMTRKKIRKSYYELGTKTCPTCHGLGYEVNNLGMS